MLTSLKISLLLIISLFVTSCISKEFVDIKDATMEGYYYEYLHELDTRKIPYEKSHVIIKIEEISYYGVVGLCAIKEIPFGANMCIITISPDYSKYKQKIILFHELTHCLFDLRNHYEEYDKSEGAYSIFNTYYDYTMPDHSAFYESMIEKLLNHDIPFMIKNK